MTQHFTNGPVFDGTALHSADGIALSQTGRITLTDTAQPDAIDLGGDILCPGFTDLQVNGGGGVMLGAGADLRKIAEAHWSLGTTRFLPTLITDTPEATREVIAAVAASDLPNIAGLHLEGPHLDSVKAGAHDPALIRPMTDDDVALYCDAASQLDTLLITLAPENATLVQLRHLAAAGVIVSLGHSNCTYETAKTYLEAGAQAVTHLWNAMSPLSSRAPGLVGAGMAAPAGIIADHIHVHPATLRASLTPQSFLVTDAMACAGTSATEFTLGGRRILRQNGRLTLEDGTLAGADLDMLGALRGVTAIGTPLPEALAMVTTRPEKLLNTSANPHWIRISSDLSACTPLRPWPVT